MPEGANVAVGDYSDWSRKYQCCGDDSGEKYVDTMRDDTPVSDQGVNAAISYFKHKHQESASRKVLAIIHAGLIREPRQD